MKENITIREMLNSDIDAIASIHSKDLNKSFLGKMGYGFLKKLYFYMLEDPSFKCFVAENNSGIHGFASITLDSAEFYRRIYKKQFFSLAKQVMLRSLRQPFLLFKSLEIFLKASHKENLNIKPELLSIAVEEGYRGQGLGRMLVNTCLSFIKTKGEESIFVIVKPYIPANNFYKSLGFIDNGQIKLYGDVWNLYWIKANSM